MNAEISKLIAGTDMIDVVRRGGVHLVRRANEYRGVCPFHTDINNGQDFIVHKVGTQWLYRCPKCEVSGDALSFIQLRYNLDFKDAVKHLQGGSNILSDIAKQNSQGVPAMPIKHDASRALKDKRDQQNRELSRKRAFELFWGARGFQDNLTDYLQGFGVDAQKLNGFPSALRFESSLKHPSGKYFPAMVARFDSPTGMFMGVQRTWLSYDGKEKAPVDVNKMSLGSISGGAIQLYPAAEKLMIAVSVEAALCVRQHFPDTPVWAAGTLPNMANIILPPQVRLVIIMAAPLVNATDKDKEQYAAWLKNAQDFWVKQNPDIVVRLPVPDYVEKIIGHQVIGSVA